MSDSESRWMVLVVPGVGEVVAWLPTELLIEGGGVIDVEHATRIVLDPRTGRVGLMKMVQAGTLPINLCAIPTWRVAEPELVTEVSKLWDRIIVPEKRVLPHD